MTFPKYLSKSNDSKPVESDAMIPLRAWVAGGTFLLSVLLYVDRVCISAAKDDVGRDLRDRRAALRVRRWSVAGRCLDG